MKAMNEATVAFLSRSANESFARTTAACFAAQLDPTLEEVNDIKTAVSEAVTNCIVHAYPDSLGLIQMRLRHLSSVSAYSVIASIRWMKLSFLSSYTSFVKTRRSASCLSRVYII